MPRACVIVSLAVAALLSAAATAHAQTASSASTPVVPEHPYRIGTAARPFAWSTAVGDLNADGRPDYAIADRLGRLGGGFAYSLEFSIAGVGSRSVTFDAPDAALAISLLDVDHDHDLDVVVSALISRVVVRVWLNDGAGRFYEAASPPPSSGARLGDLQTDAGGLPGAGAMAATATPRREITAFPLDTRPSAAAMAPERPRARGPQFRRRLASSLLRSRAPPRV